VNLLAVDPGCDQSAWVLYDTDAQRPIRFGIDPNERLRFMLAHAHEAEQMVIEMVASFGMAVGKEVFETVFWIGRFCEAFPRPFHRLYRKDIKMFLCGNNTAKDANIRRALIDLYGPGKAIAIGRKATPGPLHGISKDVWSALAVARTFADTKLKSFGKAMA
jgi:hypothetical protein